jgi:hypothetical protein
MKSAATILTPNGRRYMIQLCKHFGHRVSATYDEREGEIVFEAGKVGLRAAPETFLVWVTAAEAGALQRLEQVVESHLKRFAFREPDLTLDWRRSATA